MKISLRIWAFVALHFFVLNAAAQPTINSLSPNAANPGTTITIGGTGFNTTASRNKVFFGATKAVVTAATATSLTVTSPLGGTYYPVSVLDSSTGLTGYSRYAFLPKYNNSAYIPGSINFTAPVGFSSGSSPYLVAIGDIDGDGKPDMAVANYGSNTVSVFKNIHTTGNITSGSFAAKVDFTTGTNPFGIAIGDLDGDGKPDLVVTNGNAASISVFRNTATTGSINAGSFAAKVDFTSGSAPSDVQIADMDGDGKPDLIVDNFSSNTLSVFRNTGSTGSISTASFAAKVDFATGSHPRGVTVADIDGDGKPDIAVANSSGNTLSIFRNISGSGSFTTSSLATRVDFTTGARPIDIAIGDLDGDGKPELAVADGDSNTISVFRNISSSGSITTGSLSARVKFTTGTDPESIAIADVDGDGKPDLAAGNYASATVSVFRNTASTGTINSGSFAAGADVNIGCNLSDTRLADMDDDGKPDIIIVCTGTDAVTVASNAPFFMRPTIASVSPNTANPGTAVTITGTFFNTTAANNEVFFGATKAVVTTASATSLTVTSPIGATYGPVSVLDGSTGLTGYEQYAYLPTFDNSAYISGMVNFNAKIAFATGAAPYWVAIGDLDLDGKADLVVTNNSFATVSVFRNISTNGSITTGSFAAKVDFTTGTGPVSAAISDIDGDGKPEILVVNSGSTSVSVFRNTSTAGSLTTGSFSAKVDFTTGILPYSVAVGDLDGDGKPDMAVANRTSNTVSVFYNKAATGSISASSFATKVDFTTGTVAWNVAIGDLDGDGKPDMAVANNTSNTVSVFRNTCTQGSINSSSFAAKVDFTTVAGPYAIAIGDLDGDGKAEMAVAYNRTNARLSVFRNTASSGSITSGSFAARVDFTLVSSPRSVVIADMDGDGKPDLITANTDSGTVTAFRNTSTSGSITTSSFAAGAAFRVSGVPQTVAVGDLDGDGKPDLAVTNNSTNSVSVLRNNPLSVIYGARSLCFGNSLAFRDSATLGSWTSSAAGVATVNSATGVVTAVSSGVAIITYTVDGGSDTALVTVQSPAPSITSVSPLKGYAGSSVAINGSNFNSINVVWFGATKATISSGSSSSLSVTVPIGATYLPVSVTDTATGCGFSGYAQFPYLPTFDTTPYVRGIVTLDTRSDFRAGDGANSIAIGDLDGDGKADLAVGNWYSDSVSVFRNTSTSGAISGGSFAARVSFKAESGLESVVIGDLDGDGKADLAVANYNSNLVSVFRNTSTIGAINTGSFAARVNFRVGTGPESVAIGDIDGDGKADLVVANSNNDSISVLRNTSTGGTISSGSFAARVNFQVGGYPISIAIGDLDGDGKADLAVANYYDDSVSVLRNTSSSGAITSGSFAARVNFRVASNPHHVAIGDLDGDGKADLAVANYSSNSVSVLRNTSSSGVISSGSFAARVNFPAGNGPNSVAIGDLNGDGKADLVVANELSDSISVWRNTSSSGAISSGSFAARVNFPVGDAPLSVAIGDLDGDGKADLAVANYGSDLVSVIRNNPLYPIAGAGVICTGGTRGLTDSTTGGTWSSSAAGIATVNSGTGVVTAVAAGVAIVTYTANGGFDTALITVVSSVPAVSAITGTMAVNVAGTTTLSATPSGGTWTSSAPTTATVNSSTGVVTGILVGQAIITYTATNACGSATDTALVNVNAVTASTSGTQWSGSGNSTTTTAASSNFSTVPAATTPGSSVINVSQWNRRGTTGSSATGCYSSAGWPSSAAVDTTQNIYFTITNNATTEARVTAVTIQGQKSSSGPAKADVYYCYGTSGTNVRFGTNTATLTTSSASYVFSGNMCINPGQTATFKVCGYSAPNTSGTFRIDDNTGVTMTYATGITTFALASPSSNTPVCSGNSINFTGGTASNGVAPYTYSWSGPATFSSALQSPTRASAATTATGTYTYIVTDNLGCGDTLTTAVTVNATPTVTATPVAASICIGSNTNITAGGATSYTWSPSAGLSDSTGATVTFSGISTSTYTVTGTSTGCNGTISTTITVAPSAPAVSAITGTTAVNVSATTTLSSTPSGGTWTSSAPTTATVNSSTGVVTGILVGQAIITYTATNACGSATDTALVTVNAVTASTSGTQWSGSGNSTTTTAASSNFSTVPAATTPGSSVINVSQWNRRGTTGNSATGCYSSAGWPSSAAVDTTQNIYFTITNNATTEARVTAVTIQGQKSSSGPAKADVYYCYGTSGTNVRFGTNTATLTTSSASYVFSGNMCVNPGQTATFKVCGYSAPNTSGTFRIEDNTGVTMTYATGITTFALASPSSNTPVCSGNSINFTGGTASNGVAPYTYSWSGPATFSSALQSPTRASAATTATGTYTYIVTDNLGCGDTLTTAVTVNATPTVTATPVAASICIGSNTNITAGGATSYTWSPSAGLSDSTSATVTFSGLATSTYTVTGTTTGCSGTASQTITVSPTPTVTVSPVASTICSGNTTTITASGATTYTWSPSTGLSASTGATVTFSGTTTSTYTVTGTSAGCSATASQTITVNTTPTVTLTPVAATICSGNNTNMTASGATTYTWSPSVGLSASTGATVTFSGTATSTYTVTGTSTGCSATASQIITVNPVPVLTVTPSSTSICNGSVVTASGASTYSWAPATGLSAATGASVTVVASSATIYTITGTNTFGCIATATKSVAITAPPVIAAVSPMVGYPSSSVTISGSNFDTVANNNIVYFGATRASVVSSGSSTNLLSVTVPAGATYMPVSLLDSSTCGLSAASIAPYLPSYNDSGYDPSVIRYNSAISLSSGGNSVTVADLDGDGKSDLIVPVWASSGYINVYRNISSAGTLSSGSFASPVSFSLGTYTNIAAVGDLDGDGKPDIAVTNSGSNTVSVLRNISSPGSLTSGSFAAPVNFATGNGLTWVSICDFDGDGKPDLAVSEISDSKVGIFRNTSTRGSITTSSFSAKVSFATGLNPRTVAIGDIDGDGKPDMAISNEGGGSVSLFRNTCTPGTLDISSFAAKVDFSTGTSSVPYSVAIADLDGDNKPDVSVVVSARDSLFVFRNTATSGTITSGSLAAPVKFATGGAPRSLSVGDVNGDGKPDVVVANTSGVTVSVLRNTGAGSGISSSTFATKVDFTAGTGVISNVLADMNGDGMPEIVAPYGSGVNIFQNNPLHSITNAGPVCTGSTRPLANATAGGTWSSSASGVATISATGVVTGVSVGSANISYTVSGFRTTALVTVNTTPTITVTPVDSTICSGNTTAITASGATTYTWLPSTGLSATTGATVTCNATATTTYTITGTTGCSVTAMRTITVNSVPTITVTPSSANICMGSSVSLTASGATTYSWSPTTGLSSAVGASVTASPTVTGTYVVTGSASGCSSTRSVSINVSTQPTASISAAPFPCDGASVNVVFTGTAGDTLHYAVDSGSFVTAVLTGSTYTIATGVVTVPRSYWLHSANNLACVVTIDTSVVLTPAPNTWLGSTSADWSTTANWLCGSVPVATQNVLIPAGTTYLPVAGTSAIIYARDITIDTAVLVTLQTGAVLNIKGDLTSSGTIAGPGNVKLNAASAQRIAGKSAISNLELENSAGATISAASKLTIKQVLTITSGTLNTNDSLVLYSDSSATARVAPIPASGAAIAGNVQVMQYIQGGMRRYRFWSHPFSNYTGLSQVQNYIDVTGTGGAANGFTTTTSNAASAFRYDPVSGNSTLGYDPGWKPFVSAATSVDSNRIHRYQGIRLFFRGAKGEGLGFGTYTPTAATVKQWGTLNQGSQTVLLSKGATINQDYNMIGNPYASPVDIGTVLYDARVAGNISGSAFYVWNPNLGAAGQFQAITIGSTSASPYYLPANCAFQVRAAHNGDSLNFTENHKGAASTTVLHRDMGNGIELAIYDADHHPWDMLRIGFDNSATDGEDNSDARKLNGPDFNFYSVAADGVKLAVDARPFCSSARIPLGVSSHNARAFVIKAELLRLPADEAVYLHDKYAGTYTLLQQGDEYKFSITEDKATQGYRFELGAGPSNVSNLLRVTLNPNPATDKVAVQYTGSIAGAVTVNITDVTGQLVASRQATGTAGSVHIPIGHLAAGVYMVEVAAGNQKNVQRLVIQ